MQPALQNSANRQQALWKRRDVIVISIVPPTTTLHQNQISVSTQ
jgi:hypothetical protein